MDLLHSNNHDEPMPEGNRNLRMAYLKTTREIRRMYARRSTRGVMDPMHVFADASFAPTGSASRGLRRRGLHHLEVQKTLWQPRRQSGNHWRLWMRSSKGETLHDSWPKRSQKVKSFTLACDNTTALSMVGEKAQVR